MCFEQTLLAKPKIDEMREDFDDVVINSDDDGNSEFYFQSD